MAETLFDEGIDRILGVWPKNGANDATLYVGLFTSQTSSSVAGRTTTMATGLGSTIIEATGGGYVRKAVAAGSWGAPSTNGSGRRITAAQVSFDESTAGYSVNEVNGFFLCTVATGTAGVLIGQANFDDLEPAVVNSAGVIVRVTPSFQLNV